MGECSLCGIEPDRMGSEFLSFIIHFRVDVDKCHVNEMRHRCYYFRKRNNSTRHEKE